MKRFIPVVDIFAGAGGLGEGFAAYPGREGIRFDVRLSIESDPAACASLRLRSFYRRSTGRAREDYYRFVNGELTLEELYGQNSELHDEICGNEVWEVSLGGENFSEEELHERIGKAIEGSRDWILVGGPPCQAYSMAGRARNRGVEGYDAGNDGRHFLYQEYLRIISRHWPSVFVMENVPGILSSTAGGKTPIFERIHKDLHDPLAAEGPEDSIGRHGPRRHHYHIRPLDPDAVDKRDLFGWDFERVSDFIVSSDKFGIPQSRRRVILVGVRDDVTDVRPILHTPYRKPVPARAVLKGLPPVRSGLSKKDAFRSTANGTDETELWRQALHTANGSQWLRCLQERGDNTLAGKIKDVIRGQEKGKRGVPPSRGGEVVRPSGNGINYRELEPFRGLHDFIADSKITRVRNHSTREHMLSDLHRYLFVSVFGLVHGRSPKLPDFPHDLLPEHRNVSRALSHGDFADRFRVQLWNEPSTTVVSHLSRDGHYFIHPDPRQCRSLTVREAARLQTFPDSYVFCGNRSDQYEQVGNAVPPWLGLQIAATIAGLFDRLDLQLKETDSRADSGTKKEAQVV
ncbi:DNA cytosine methyltransferase [Pseudomonadota bacterium]